MGCECPTHTTSAAAVPRRRSVLRWGEWSLRVLRALDEREAGEHLDEVEHLLHLAADPAGPQSPVRSGQAATACEAGPCAGP